MSNRIAERYEAIRRYEADRLKIKVIDNFKPIKDYTYELDDEKNYLSWIQSRNLI